ncbi:hypothetical protein F5Y12DRAFT_719486 [Xylaria sp. FL1777]|nr:hypothetical protein F5Y12DRAFT_719486 [Xylaria sp. FL1777]
MASSVIQETFYRVATQPGSKAKPWNRQELIRCRATETGITTETNLKGQVNPIFVDWVETKPELQKELEQPILLASKILEAVGLPWLSDFLIDDIFDENYPGRESNGFSIPISAHEKNTTPHSIVRHHRVYRATRERQSKWRAIARDTLRNDLPKLIQWQIDEDIFQQRGWNGYTCRHPRGNLPLGEIDKYETIKKFDGISPQNGSRNLTILVTAEYPTRLAELRRQGKARGEEYLLTAFMATVTILHELGHAIYWKDRRSLTWDLREPFYGADLEMELGDSFIAAIFGGWIPVPVREIDKPRKDFSFTDGVAWRQALSWDYHRMRPKYRAHYSIPVDYIARLFTEASWSINPDKAMELIRPKFLTGNSIALRTVGLYTPLEQSNRHATAAIADFHCHDDGWVWNRRPGAWFRIPQYDGSMYPELELPTAGEDAMRPPMARETRKVATVRGPTPSSLSSTAKSRRDLGEQETPRTRAPAATDERVETITQTEMQIRGGDTSLPLVSPPLNVIATVEVMKMKLSPRKSEYSPRKFLRGSPTTKILRPILSGSPVLGCDVDVSAVRVSRKRDRAMTSPLARGRASGVQLPREQRPLSPSRGQVEGHRRPQHAGAKHGETPRPLWRVCHDKEDADDESIPCSGCSGNNSHHHNHHNHHNADDVGSHGRNEISVDELKKRLSQLIGLSLTELQKLLDGPQREAAGVE